MNDQNLASGPTTESREGDGMTTQFGKVANDALSKASEIAHDTADKAKQAASDGAAGVSQHVKELLDRQIESGATTVGHFARSAKRAAQDLEPDAPQLAGIVRSVADHVEGYAGDLRHKSADELVQSASDFTRRQPALVFGLAALAGFFVFRTLKSAPSYSAPSNTTPSVRSPTLQPPPHGGEIG